MDISIKKSGKDGAKIFTRFFAFWEQVNATCRKGGVTEALKAENLKYHLFFYSRDDIISMNTNTFIER